jgi:hypothetical protein
MHKTAIDGNYVPKATFEAERETNKTLKGQVDERDKQITELGKFKGTAEELQTKVTALEAANKTAKEKFDADLLKAQTDAALRTELKGKVVDAEDVIPKLDMTKIVFKDGKIESGLNEQLETLKKAKPHYFVQEQSQQKPAGWLFGHTPPESGDQPGGSQKDEASEFGKQLAQSKVSGETVAAKATEHYFK